MTKEEQKKLHQKIEEAITKTSKDIKRLEEATQPISPENSIGRISRMDAINNKSVAEASLRTTRRKLAKLKLALSKAEKPNFGFCTLCKKPIPIARLMYMPESTRCVNCAEK